MVIRNIPLGAIVREALGKTFTVAKFFCLLHVVQTYWVHPVLTEGPSMLPSIDLDRSIFFAEKLTSRSGKLSRGDVVTLFSPEEPMQGATKRIVALEGDSVTFTSDSDNTGSPQTVVVPKGHVWVQGDNAGSSIDSRHFGAVPYGLIHSRLFWRVWPLKGFGAFGERRI